MRAHPWLCALVTRYMGARAHVLHIQSMPRPVSPQLAGRLRQVAWGGNPLLLPAVAPCHARFRCTSPQLWLAKVAVRIGRGRPPPLPGHDGC